MRRVIRRSITTDAEGHALHGDTERIADDGDGRVHAVVRRSTMACQSCRRPVSETAELRGCCDHCRQRRLCVRCEKQCGVCGRNLCGHCRRGFVGAITMTVCPVCLVRLHERQAYDDRLMLERVLFERHLHQQQQMARMDALRLQAERTALMADLQGARLRLTAQLAEQRRPPSLMGVAMAKVWNYGTQLLR